MKTLKPLKLQDKLPQKIASSPKTKDNPLRVLPKKSAKRKIILALVLVFSLLFLFLIIIQTSDSRVFNYIFGKKEILKAKDNHINVLLLGMAGGQHEGPTLTDTIMVASYDLTTHDVTLISLPRDLWLDKHQTKLNTVYQIGQRDGQGLKLAEEEIGDILGLSIPYGIRIDFNGFIKAVDLVGGVDVEVAQSFDDYLYPIEGKETELCGYQEKEMEITEEQAKQLQSEKGLYKVLFDPEGKIATASAKDQKNIAYTDKQVVEYFNCRFEHLQFKKGLLHLDGATALKYIRSRHGTNREGTDFARSKRQQQVLQAFKSKALSFDTLTDLQKMIGLLKTFGDSIETDIDKGEYMEFAKLARQVNLVRTYVIDTSGDQPLLTTPPPADYGGAWVLVPADQSYARIHQFVDTALTGSFSASGSAKLLPNPSAGESATKTEVNQ